VGKLEGKRPQGRPEIGEGIIFICILEKRMEWYGLDYFGLG
jgi:hypothetical protein